MTVADNVAFPDGHRVRLAGFGQEFAVDDPSASPGPAHACIRPEHVRVDHRPPAEPEDPSVNRLSGTVEVAVFQGASIRCTVRTGSGLVLEAVCPPPPPPAGVLAAGTEVCLGIAARDVHLLPEHTPEYGEVVAA